MVGVVGSFDEKTFGKVLNFAKGTIYRFGQILPKLKIPHLAGTPFFKV
jgi:hypothetical protein